MILAIGVVLFSFYAYFPLEPAQPAENQGSPETNLDSTLMRPVEEEPALSFSDSLSDLDAPPIKSEIWDQLLELDYQPMGVYGYIPSFTENHFQLNGKTLVLEGYMYPLDERKVQKWFMLSYFPISTCFFCGAAGPESIVEVNSPKGIPLQKGRVKVKGKMVLNTDNPERLFYIFNDAQQVH